LQVLANDNFVIFFTSYHKSAPRSGRLKGEGGFAKGKPGGNRNPPTSPWQKAIRKTLASLLFFIAFAYFIFC